MLVLQIDQVVRLRGDIYVVRGLAPMGVTPRRAHLESVTSGERVDAVVEDIRAERTQFLSDLEELGFNAETRAILADAPVPLRTITALLLPDAA